MLPALASRMALRRRALPSGSPPPERAATVISLMNLVKSLPRLASSAPFLCLILCHFECPDMISNPYKRECGLLSGIYHKSPAERRALAAPGFKMIRGFIAQQKLFKLFILLFCFNQYWQISVGIFPGREEILVFLSAPGGIASERRRPGQTEMSKGAQRGEDIHARVVKNLLKLGGRLFSGMLLEISLSAQIIVSYTGHEAKIVSADGFQ